MNALLHNEFLPSTVLLVLAGCGPFWQLRRFCGFFSVRCTTTSQEEGKQRLQGLYFLQ